MATPFTRKPSDTKPILHWDLRYGLTFSTTGDRFHVWLTSREWQVRQRTFISPINLMIATSNPSD